ncbi:hypothetical protein Tco_1126436 [Tanacetum coccineum]
MLRNNSSATTGDMRVPSPFFASILESLAFIPVFVAMVFWMEHKHERVPGVSSLPLLAPSMVTGLSKMASTSLGPMRCPCVVGEMYQDLFCLPMLEEEGSPVDGSVGVETDIRQKDEKSSKNRQNRARNGKA